MQCLWLKPIIALTKSSIVAYYNLSKIYGSIISKVIYTDVIKSISFYYLVFAVSSST